MCQRGQPRAREPKEKRAGSETRCNYFRGFHGALLFILTRHRQKIKHLQLSVCRDLWDCTEAPHQQFSISRFIVGPITVDEGSETLDFWVAWIKDQLELLKQKEIISRVIERREECKKHRRFFCWTAPTRTLTPGILRGDHVWYCDFIGIMMVLS